MSRPTNCKNCGAILHDDICEYCGTDYGECETETCTLHADGKPIKTIVKVKHKPTRFGMSMEEAVNAAKALANAGMISINEARGIVALPEGVDIVEEQWA